MKLYEAINDALVQEGTEVVFALMGDGNQDLICDLGERKRMPIIHCRHEQNAVAMADGYSRLSGKIGVATCTQGPGLTNTATSLAVAQAYGSPVLLLAGACSFGDVHNPQRIDQHALSLLLAGAGTVVEGPRSLDIQLDMAFRRLRGLGGPFVLNIPQNVGSSETLSPQWTYQPRYHPEESAVPLASSLEQAAEVLTRAQHPVILVGRGAMQANAGAVISQLAEQLGAPICTTLPAKGLCADSPLWIGVCGGLGEGIALTILPACDCLLAIGASMNQWTTHFGSILSNKQILQIDADQAAFGTYSRVDLALPGDAQATTQVLFEAVKRRMAEPRTMDARLQRKIEQAAARFHAPLAYETGEDGTIDPRQAIRELDRLLPQDRTVVVAGGHAAMLTCQYLTMASPANWICTSVDFGALGQGLATAIGATFARPGKRIIHITADGDFLMNLADFDTAVRYQVPLTIVILNDQSFGQERHDLAHKGLPITYAMQASPDFARVAESFGARGYRFETVDSLAALGQVLDQAAQTPGPVVLDIHINGNVESRVSQEIAKALS
jgi:acetolactate synthase-1/2/3 large subunit